MKKILLASLFSTLFVFGGIGMAQAVTITCYNACNPSYSNVTGTYTLDLQCNGSSPLNYSGSLTVNGSSLSLSKNCPPPQVDNGCAAITCTGSTCWNSFQAVNGTKNCAPVDNGCATSTCTFNTCWNNISWVNGTMACDNGCASSTCQSSNSGMPTTCWNGISTVAGTKTAAFSDICIPTPVTCTQADCGNTIPSATVSCSRIDATNCMNATTCAGSCPTPALQTCPACAVGVSGWQEVAP